MTIVDREVTPRGGPTPARMGRIALAVAALVQVPLAQAVSLSEKDSDFQLRFDNTVKYSAGFRVKSPSSTLVADINQDDGDRNFSKGLISNRLDVLSEFDLRFKDSAGLRLSAAGWYDTVYHHSNDNDSPTTANNLSVANDEFSHRTRKLHGGNAEVLDAFAFFNGKLGSMPATVRLGRYSLLYGESLFFGGNGISGAQSPLDVIKLLSVPGSQFKEIIRPVEQISGQLQVLSNVSIGAYYQFKWHSSILPSSGSYFSTVDVLEGGERLLFGPVDPITRLGPALTRDADQRAKNSGQGGLQVRWRPSALDVELGFYAVRYHDKTPQFYLYPTEGRYHVAYPENIKAYGVSFSTQLGDVNVSGETSVRRNAPLVSEASLIIDGVTVPAGSVIDNDRNPAYAVGNTAHAQVSAIYIGGPTPLWASSTFLGEIAWNRRTSISKNPSSLAVNSSRDAWALRFILEPAWFQVVPELDLSAPIGLGYSGHGNSSAVGFFNAGGKNGGDLSLGLKATYKQNWRFSLNFTHYFGSEGTVLDSASHVSFKQSSTDRDFVALSVQTSF